MLKDIKICFIGCGNMGRSLIGGLLANGHPAGRIAAADPDADQRDRAGKQFGVHVFERNGDAIRDAQVVVLAVKPQVMRASLKSIAADVERQHPLVLSIAAGIRISALRRWLGYDAAIVRVMPNTPSLIQTGAAGLYANESVTPPQRDLAEAIMRSVGVALWLESEDLLDAVTAVSGSGPAYFFLIMEHMESAARELGLTAEQARLLVSETALGAAKMVMESDSDAGILRKQVTSPGGTTERALQILAEGDIEALIHNALRAARDRSIELADTLGEGD